MPNSPRPSSRPSMYLSLIRFLGFDSFRTRIVAPGVNDCSVYGFDFGFGFAFVFLRRPWFEFDSVVDDVFAFPVDSIVSLFIQVLQFPMV